MKGTRSLNSGDLSLSPAGQRVRSCTGHASSASGLHVPETRPDIQLIEQARDQIKWRHEASGTYTANSAYKAQFLGRTTSEISNFTWKTWAPQRVKIFIWLLTKNRLWCNDRLQRRGWQNSYFCQLCLRNLESADHLFWKCNVATTVWVETASRTGCASLSPIIWAHNKTAREIITKMISKARPEYKKGTRTMIVLVLSEIWKERDRKSVV